MYAPKHFEETRSEVLQNLMREQPLATLVTLGPDGPDANLIPLLFTPDEATSHGILRGHVARANPLWREHPADTPVLAIFHGPESYISPSWYATKAETGKVVPTWNYAVVQARGTLRVIEDPQWLRAQIGDLTRQSEAVFDHPWFVTDAPADYIEKLIEAIVGVEIRITHLQGKWKVSQNQPPANRHGVVAGLREQASGQAVLMASLVQEHSR